MKNSERQYKGYIISAEPYQLQDSKRWRPKITIYRHPSSSIDTVFQPFTDSANTFESESETIKHCYILGAKIIDGEIEGCSISHL
jgi:hypothetical protein